MKICIFPGKDLQYIYEVLNFEAHSSFLSDPSRRGGCSNFWQMEGLIHDLLLPKIESPREGMMFHKDNQKAKPREYIFLLRSRTSLRGKPRQF